MASPAMQALQSRVRSADYNPNQFGGGGNLTYDPRKRLQQLEDSYRMNPGRAPNGTGRTGLMSGDSRGYAKMLEEQQEYLRLRTAVANMPQESAPAPPQEQPEPERPRYRPVEAPQVDIPSPASVPTPAAPQAQAAPDLPSLAPAAAPLPTAGGGGGATDSRSPIVESGGGALNPNAGRRVRPVSMRVLIGRLY